MTACAPDRSYASANPARQRGRDLPDERIVVPDAHGGVQVDELYFGKPPKPLDPGVDVARFDRQLFALHELHDSTILQVD
jgi:hypothetical protein